MFGGLCANGADLLDVLHGNHTSQDGKQDDGADDELQQVQEDGTDGLDVVVGKIRILAEQQAHDDRQNQGDEDLRRQIGFQFLHLTFPLFF